MNIERTEVFIAPILFLLLNLAHLHHSSGEVLSKGTVVCGLATMLKSLYV